MRELKVIESAKVFLFKKIHLLSLILITYRQISTIIKNVQFLDNWSCNSSDGST